MRHSVIPQAGGSQFAKLRSDYVLICDGNACAALLLDVFDWRSAQDENGITDTPWMRCSVRWLGERLYGGFGDTAIKSGLELLVEKGYVERRAGMGGGRSLEYRLNVHSVKSANALLDPDECIRRNQTIHSSESPNLARASQAVPPDLPQTEQPDRAQGELLPAENDARQNATQESLLSMPEPRDGRSQLKEDVEEVWAHYVETIKPKKTELLPQERKLISEIIKQDIADKDELKLAITGCSCSDLHMGRVAGRTGRKVPYNTLTHIIKGKRGGRTDREQIDMMIGYAQRAGKTTTQVAGTDATVLTTAQLVDSAPQIKRATINQRVLDILTGRRNPNREDAVQWAAKAERMMREEFNVQPIFEGEGADVRVAHWERIA